VFTYVNPNRKGQPLLNAPVGCLVKVCLFDISFINVCWLNPNLWSVFICGSITSIPIAKGPLYSKRALFTRLSCGLPRQDLISDNCFCFLQTNLKLLIYLLWGFNYVDPNRKGLSLLNAPMGCLVEFSISIFHWFLFCNESKSPRWSRGLSGQGFPFFLFCVYFSCIFNFMRVCARGLQWGGEGWSKKNATNSEQNTPRAVSSSCLLFLPFTLFATYYNKPQVPLMCNAGGSISNIHLTATHCNTLQHTATQCNTLQQQVPLMCNAGGSISNLHLTATHCNALQHTATHCNTLQQQVPLMCNAGGSISNLHLTATHCNALQHTATHCNTLQQQVPLMCNAGGSISNLHLTHDFLDISVVVVIGGLWRITECAIFGNAATANGILISDFSAVEVCCSVLQCVAVCCSVLQCVAVCCSVFQCVAVCFSVLQCQRHSHQRLQRCGGVLQYVAMCCNMSQCVAVCRSVLQYVAVCCSVSQCVAVCCRVSQYVAVCCSVLHCQRHSHQRLQRCGSVLQCVAICCSVLQCVALCRSVLQ